MNQSERAETVVKAERFKMPGLRKKYLTAILLIIGIIVITVSCGKNQAGTMKLIRTDGVVQVFDNSKKEIPALEDMNLYSGYEVDTKNESYAWISLDSAKLAKMDRTSGIEILKYKKNLMIQLNYGKIYFNVSRPLDDDETMSIRTSTMAVGIRGTSGWVEVPDQEHMIVYILEGTVECVIIKEDSSESISSFVSQGEKAVLSLVDGKMDIIVEQFKESDIPDFILAEQGQDPFSKNEEFWMEGPEGNLEVQQPDHWEDSPQVAIPWSEAGMTDHVMDWKDAGLEQGMRDITGIYDRNLMLSDVWELQDINLTGLNITDVSSLTELQNITYLDLSGNMIGNFHELSSLPHLETLLLASNEITDLSFLSNMTNLGRLVLPYNTIQDLSPLSGLINLWDLDLSYNQISDISPLENLKELYTLSLFGNQIRNINSIHDMPKLHNLYLSDNQISDITPMVNIPDLEELRLNSNQISDFASLVAVLEKCRSFKSLDISNNQISDITGLEKLTGLEQFISYRNQITDLTPLSGLTKLTDLHLSGNQISDISPLSDLTLMYALSLDANHISDISALRRLTNISVLYLDENQISDVSPLRDMTSLSYLSLSDNQISDISSLTGLTNLSMLFLWNNPIDDVSALDGIDGLLIQY